MDTFQVSNNTTAQAVLGHTRLSIIDLSKAGHQPMTSQDGRYTLTYNGEIYNYRELKDELINHGHTFSGNSDTEVLIHAWSEWGVSALKRLSGMFAFAIYDKEEGLLKIVRDHCGVKPLFYLPHFNDGVWAFSSEIPAIFELLPNKPRKICPLVAYKYLCWGIYDDSSSTFFDGIASLLPGHLITIDVIKGLVGEPQRWWYPSIKQTSALSFEEAASELRDRLLESIKLHLRSDVPIGVALSGGLDSSVIACAIRYLYPSLPIHTFTFSNQGHSSDETKWASMANNYIGAVPEYVKIDSEEFIRDLDDLISIQGEPFMSTSVYAQYRVYNAAKKSGVSVVIDGQGADEVLAGYSGYPEARISSLAAKREYFQLLHFLYSWGQWPGRSFRQTTRMALSELLPASLINLIKTFKRIENPAWLDWKWLESNYDVRDLAVPTCSKPSIKTRSLMHTLRESISQHGLPCLLRHADRCSMQWSVESRVPFLSPSLIDFLFSLPEEYLLSRKGRTKNILREAMRGVVPDCILDRRDKIGFRSPEGSWLKPLLHEPDSILRPLSALPFVNYEMLVKEFILVSRSDSNSSLLWRLVNLSRWMEVESVDI